MAKESPLAGAIHFSLDNYADDVLRGVREIATYLGETERRTHYLLERRMLPAYQIGSRWEMRKSTHLAHIAKLETA
jgi:hypothetical protein